jgi:TolA-binding protein
MSESGDPEEAVRILQRLIRTHPEDPAVPGALFKAATLFHNRLRRPEKAKAILRTMVKKYPQSELTPAAMDYLHALNRGNR